MRRIWVVQLLFVRVPFHLVLLVWDQRSTIKNNETAYTFLLVRDIMDIYINLISFDDISVRFKIEIPEVLKIEIEPTFHQLTTNISTWKYSIQHFSTFFWKFVIHILHLVQNKDCHSLGKKTPQNEKHQTTVSEKTEII